MAHPTRGVGARSRAHTSGGGPGHGTGSAARGRAGVADRTDQTALAPPTRQELAALRSRLTALVEPVVAREGLDLEEVEVTRMGRRFLVRITVDADGGVGHDELSDVSRAVSDALDEAEEHAGEFTTGSYTLELSSPGIDRPLTQPRHWHRNVGRLVAVKVAGRSVTGRVTDTSTNGVSLDVDGRRLDATFDELGPGRVQVEFTRLAELTDEELGPEITEVPPPEPRAGANRAPSHAQVRGGANRAPSHAQVRAGANRAPSHAQVRGGANPDGRTEA